MKMASSPWTDIDNKFCLCSICLEQLKEPKQLPCLHRYCKDCLSSVIQRSHKVIRCRDCREEVQIPSNGVDGFKTDFYTKNLVEYVKIQQSLRSDEMRECYGCSKHLRVAAYCFKCNDFLCEDCHSFHVTNRMMKDHEKHTLSLKDIEEKNITIEKLGSMRDAPRCGTHPEKLSELYCETCDNLPVCMACMLGEHKGHHLHEVKALAKMKREELALELEVLKEIKKCNKRITPIQAKERLMFNVNIGKEKVLKMHDEKDEMILTKLQDIEEKRKHLKQEKQNKEKKLFDFLQREMENEIKGIKRKYEKMFETNKLKLTDDFQVRESFLEKEVSELQEKRERLKRNKVKLLESIEEQMSENVKIIDTISKHFSSLQKRFETLNKMASSLLTSENDWSAVQSIPDIFKAAKNMKEDLKRDFPELTTLTHVSVKYSLLEKSSAPIISEQVHRKLHIGNPFCYLCGVTNSGNGNIVLSGAQHGLGTFIIMIDINGTMLKWRKLYTGKCRFERSCKHLSQHRVASVCEPNEIGMYDVRNGSYVKKNISDISSSWPEDRNVTCVATDPVNNHILVGGFHSRDVYVFDIQLHYLYMLKLPTTISWPRDMIVSQGNLLLCDYDKKKSFVTTMDGLESRSVAEFMGPDIKGKEFGPRSVCTDKNGFVYILWKDVWCPGERYLIQYDYHGNQVLATKKLDENAEVVTVVETFQGEMVAIGTNDTQIIYLYHLTAEY